MDADLEDSPEDIPQLIEKIKEGYDMSACRRRERKHDLVRRVGSYTANIIISFLNLLDTLNPP